MRPAGAGRWPPRAEPSLRLWLFVALCGALSTLLLVALAVDSSSSSPSSSSRPIRAGWGFAPVFLPAAQWPLAAFAWRRGAAAAAATHDGTADGTTNERPSMRLVETLPVGDFALNASLPATHDVLLNHTRRATRSIDLSAMYWNLLGADDRKVYSPEAMTKFGADRGAQLFQALVDAAQRGVTLRILTAGDAVGHGSGSDGHGSGGGVDALPDELQRLVKAAPPGRVVVHTWSGAQWYGGGILHQKLWIFDRRDVYVGSANMDWKSLAQVLEMGVVLENLPPEAHLLQDLQRLFDVWWLWSELDARAPNATSTYVSEKFQAELRVPAWSPHVPHAARQRDPFADAGLEAYANMAHQLHASLADGSRAQLFVASAPAASTARRTRTFDEDALVYTIETARARVSLSVMDFTPYSMYSLATHANASIWWPALTDAVLAGVFGKRGLHVRLLISQWQHTKRAMLEALHALEQQAALCKFMTCGGRLDIKIFRVPGWQNTTTATNSQPPLWPAYSRVNHAKFIVSDRRVNVGTSNMEWGYFYTTAGISLNTDHEPTRAAMEAVFDRNWNSSYAVPLRDVLAEL